MEKRGFFPLFLDVREKNVVFFGGGKIAQRRVEAMSHFACQITVIAPEVTDSIRALADAGEIRCLPEKYEASMLENADMVLICTDDGALNHEIYTACRERGILANNCSNREECDFYFPGIAMKEETVVAVNAGGNAHKKAADLRRQIQQLLDEEKI